MKKTMFLFALIFMIVFCISNTLYAQWIPDDNGKMYWWEAPKTNDKVVYKKRRSTRSTPSQTNAEVLFLMDTSGSMDDEFSALCGKIDGIVQGLQNENINIEYKILGITSNKSCTSNTVYNLVANPTVNHSEDWGPAVEDVANQYSWKSGYARIAIPISDEGAENGDSWTSSDDAAIDRAKAAAKENNVGVIPIVCSGYDQYQLSGATELADYCWGDVFISTDAATQLVDGIIAAINQIFNPVSEKLNAQIFVDDAYADASVCGSINKISGDIAFLVVQILNGDENPYNVDLEVTYPSNWDLVEHNSIMKREMLVSEELDLTETTALSSGKVTIKDISVPIDIASTVNENEGKSFEYIVKLIIPQNEPVGIYPVNASISSSSLLRSSIMASEDAFAIHIVNKGDMIVTNRHQLINRYQNSDDLSMILKSIHNIASYRSTVVFYADWWDEYDNFSNLNPEGLVIKDWDRDSDINYNDPIADINQISNHIDLYTHYWADKLGGKDKEHYLLIIGGDRVIPYYRFSDPTGKAKNGSSKDDSGTIHYNYDWYGITPELLKAAKNNYLFTDSIYCDSDGNGWDNGEVDNMFVGRLVAETSDELLNILTNVIKELSKTRNNKNVIVSCIEEDKENMDMVVEIFRDEVGYFIFNEYKKNEKTVLLMDDHWNFDGINSCLASGVDYWVFAGHGNPYVGGTKDNTLFGGWDFDSAKNDFENYYPHLIMMACGMGISDWDPLSDTSNTLVFSGARNNITSYIASTTLTYGDYNNTFMNNYVSYCTGGIDLAFNDDPIPVGKALNKAKRNTQNEDSLNRYSLCNLGYILYGTPWKLINPPSVSRKRSIHRNERLMLKNNLKRSSNPTNSSITVDESVSAYTIIEEQGFNFIDIEDYNQYKAGAQNIPVLPYKRKTITLPEDATVICISVTRSSPVDLGSLNIPVYNSFPPIFGMVHPAEYMTATASIDAFTQTHNIFNTNEEQYQNCVIDLFPATFDAQTQQTILYTQITIQVDYETNQKGILLSSNKDKQSYASGELINVNTILENISEQAVDFEISLHLKDGFDNSIFSRNETFTVNPLSTAQTAFQLDTPSTGGSYWVETNVSDGVNNIGNSVQQINVNPGAITNIEIPRCSPGSVAEFKVTFVNDSTSEIETSIGLLLYEGTTLKADFLPKVHTITANDTLVVPFSWAIPSDFPGGNYLAVATATTDGYATSSSKTFSIGSFNEGWNLFSLAQVPNNTSISAVLDSISGQYYSVWAYENGAWSAYFPDTPGLSDLTTLTAGKGFWINMKIASNFSSPGTSPEKSISLTSGWNLTGFNSSTSQSTADALSSIAGKYQSVWTYEEGAWKLYDPISPGFSDLYTLEPGKGYWIKTNEACTWALP